MIDHLGNSGQGEGSTRRPEVGPGDEYVLVFKPRNRLLGVMVRSRLVVSSRRGPGLHGLVCVQTTVAQVIGYKLGMSDRLLG